MRTTANVSLALSLAALLGGALPLLSCTDPVLDARIASLGPEVGTPGPNHRPGQPCCVCHSEFGTDPKHIFTVAGTVFDSPTSLNPVPDVEVRLVSADNKGIVKLTNASGNFYLTEAEYPFAFPLRVRLSKGAVEKSMQSHIGREPSCAGCHFDPPNVGEGRVHYTAFQAVGHVYFSAGP